MSSRAFSAKSGQFEAGSTTTGSSLRLSTPPDSLILSIAIRATSFSEVSLIAMVPESECKIPTLIGPVSSAFGAAGAAAAEAASGALALSAGAGADCEAGPLQAPTAAAPRRLITKVAVRIFIFNLLSWGVQTASRATSAAKRQAAPVIGDNWFRDCVACTTPTCPSDGRVFGQAFRDKS